MAAARVKGSKANAELAGITPGSVRAGATPVWVGPAVTAARSVAMPGQVRVAIAARKVAVTAGVSGVIFGVAQVRGSGATSAHVSLDYTSFAYADGGDFAARLHLVEMPACVLTTPQVATCRKQTPVASSNDVATDRLGANVTLPAAGSSIVLGAVTSPTGSGGSYSATPLSDDGSWSAGGSAGAFTYSYPIAVPPVPGGLVPSVSLNYDSQAVDGLTSSTNDQASWIGDGWDYQSGYIERDYQSCQQTSAKTGDLCWSSNDVTTLSLGGMTTTLVQDSSTGKWHAENDQGDVVTYETGSGSNGTHDDDYWVITDPDGTSYYFGENELPGYASGDAQTNSAWTVPVYAPSSGQPCY